MSGAAGTGLFAWYHPFWLARATPAPTECTEEAEARGPARSVRLALESVVAGRRSVDPSDLNSLASS